MSDKAWVSHATGFVQPTGFGQSKTIPAVAAHRGELWCLWASPTEELFYAKTTHTNDFQARLDFPDKGVPTLASLNGILHAVIVRDSGETANYLYNDLDNKWLPLATLGDSDSEDGTCDSAAPALVAYHNSLFLVLRRGTTLVWSSFNEHAGQWAELKKIIETPVQGIPALFVLNGKLHVLCLSNDETREILGFEFSVADTAWESCEDISEGKAAYGVSAASYGDRAYLGFQENGPEDVSHAIYISEYYEGSWHPQEQILSETSADPPQIAILNGRIHCIYNSNTESRDLRWLSRPILDYSLSTWMGELPDDVLLSDITIPGTHDSCARSDIPFVRTQYLSIAQQLALGLRFFDLRCRVHNDGKLYLYHGGIPINFPFYLSLNTVMDEIFTFQDSPLDGNPTEAVVVSINNDNAEQGNENPGVFYNAIQAHIDLTPRRPDGTERWISARDTPTLGSARGRVVLLRRFAHNPTLASPDERIGIDLSAWVNNNPFFTLVTPDNVTIHLQDKWQYSDRISLEELVATKYGFVKAHLERAINGKKCHWFLNFCSAVGDPVEKGEVAESKWIAVGAHTELGFGKSVQGMNPTVQGDFDWGSGKLRLGIVALDYPELPRDSDLVARLIDSNM